MAQQGNTYSPERRKYARLRKEFVVRVIEADRYYLPAAELTGKDISLGGIGIETHRHYPVGSALVSELLLPEPEEHALPQSPQKKGVFQVQGQVIWSHHLEGGRFATGLRFVAMDERQLKTLSQLIAEENQ